VQDVRGQGGKAAKGRHQFGLGIQDLAPPPIQITTSARVRFRDEDAQPSCQPGRLRSVGQGVGGQQRGQGAAPSEVGIRIWCRPQLTQAPHQRNRSPGPGPASGAPAVAPLRWARALLALQAPLDPHHEQRAEDNGVDVLVTVVDSPAIRKPARPNTATRCDRRSSRAPLRTERSSRGSVTSGAWSSQTGVRCPWLMDTWSSCRTGVATTSLADQVCARIRGHTSRRRGSPPCRATERFRGPTPCKAPCKCGLGVGPRPRLRSEHKRPANLQVLD
jgi:hypothetical protein